MNKVISLVTLSLYSQLMCRFCSLLRNAYWKKNLMALMAAHTAVSYINLVVSLLFAIKKIKEETTPFSSQYVNNDYGIISNVCKIKIDNTPKVFIFFFKLKIKECSSNNMNVPHMLKIDHSFRCQLRTLFWIRLLFRKPYGSINWGENEHYLLK